MVVKKGTSSSKQVEKQRKIQSNIRVSTTFKFVSTENVRTKGNFLT